MEQTQEQELKRQGLSIKDNPDSYNTQEDEQEINNLLKEYGL